MRPILVLELCDTSLSSYIRHHPDKVPATCTDPRSIRLVLRWAIEIMDGLRFIHQEELVHRDLKLENVLVRNDNNDNNNNNNNDDDDDDDNHMMCMR